ncbi:uncharacterized protein LOC127948417 [Carassius gibelio]|uniref:uncharacterized protein LOC127948417 n=1 Tax=Carassius gibelio TaxID=101364 RepID=UPI0022786225|nr:uncharacterized protein LOC127948417 [Carassius gibelio]
MENGDVSLYDDTRAGVLMVFFRELKAADAGTYRCGVKESEYTERFTEIQLSVKHDAKYPTRVTESVYLGGEVIITCQIPEKHKVHVCKEDDNHICQNISSSKVTEMSGSSERNEERVVTVSISNVSVRDAGVYWCGAETRDTDLTFISLNTQIQLNLITKVGVSSVSGYSGGRLMIKCEHPQYKTKPKYICKESDGCSERKNPGVQDEWMENGDVSLYDDTRAGVLMVFFRELKAADAGTYRCGVKVSDYTERFTEIQLSVRHDAKYPKRVTESVYLGGEVIITCQIPEKHKVHVCKEDDNHICQNISSSKVTEMSGSSERNEERVVTVSISNVSVRDAGVYWCGAETRDTDLTFISLNTQIQLNLITKVGVSSVSGYSGAGLMIKCEHPQYKTKPKYICKESDGCSDTKSPGVRGSFHKIGTPKAQISRDDPWEEWIENGDVSLYDDTRAGVLMVFFRELKAADAGTYRCGVKVSRYTERFTELQLSVKHDAKYPVVVNKTAFLGEVHITCQIPEKHKVHVCKEDDNHICQNISSSKVTEMSGSSERNEERVVTVSISNVSVRDAGVYWCGAETRDTDLTFISLNTQIQLNLITKVGVSRVSGYSGGRLMIKCEHPQYKTKPKYICKESDGCSERKSPGVQDEWIENGDVSLYDDTRAGVLMVFFRELKAADAGTYRCGVKESDYTERFTEIQLSVKHDAKYPKRVTGSVYLGGEVIITCQIPEEHKVHFCKEDDNHICQNISSSKVTEMSGSSERNEERVVTVSISNVSVRDAGVYWCGAETRDTDLTFISLNTQIQLNLIMPPVVRREGESAEIFCPYDSIYKSKLKSLCKGKCSTRDRNPLSETVREEKETKTGRLTLKDNVTASVFTGTITALTAEDAGKYWCAVTLETELNYLHTHLMVIMNEELNLTKYEGDDVSIQCKHQDEDQKRFCKAHEVSMCVKDGVSLETIRDDRFSFSIFEASAGVFTVNITDLREEDSGIYWCGDHVITKVCLEVNKRASDRIITSCIFVTLLLMGASVLLLYKLGYIKTKDQHPSPDRTEMSGREAFHAACDYENIRDVRQCVVVGTEETVLYSTATHPTDSSDTHNTLYSKLQLPTNPSDGLLYASVRFQKHEESLSDATVTSNKEDFYCNYTTVSPRMSLN